MDPNTKAVLVTIGAIMGAGLAWLTWPLLLVLGAIVFGVAVAIAMVIGIYDDAKVHYRRKEVMKSQMSTPVVKARLQEIQAGRSRFQRWANRGIDRERAMGIAPPVPVAAPSRYTGPDPLKRRAQRRRDAQG